MKYLFVHIAKTAGTSVNSVFQKTFGVDNCVVHVESESSWGDDALRPGLVANKRFISGHRTFSDFSAKLDLRDFFTFTFLRNPVSHVVSHLAWIRRLKEPGHEQAFRDHPEYIQGLATKLHSVNFGEPRNVVDCINSLTPQEFALLDNPQVRYLRAGTGGVVKEPDVDTALGNLQAMSEFGYVESFDDDLRRICQVAGVSAPDQAPRENVRTGGEDPLAASNELLVEALYPLIRYDMILYLQSIALHRGGRGDVAEAEAKQELVARVDGISEGRVFGWARFGFSIEPVILDIFVNGIFFRSVSASNRRIDLNEKFGLDCAFECDISTVKNFSTVAVRERKTGNQLINSPVMIGS